MRWVRWLLSLGELAAESRQVVLIEAVLAASKLSLPFLTLYLVQARGVSYATAGLLVAVRGLGGLLAVLVAGALADRWGEKPVVLVLLAGASISAAAIPVLQTLPALLVGFFVMGAFVSAVQPPFSSMVVRSVPVRRWTQAYAAEYWALNVGFAITAIVGGRVALMSFDWLFYLEAAGTLVALVLVVRTLPSPQRCGSVRRPGVDSSLALRARRALSVLSLAARDRLAVALISSTLLFALCLSQMTGTLPLDMKANGYGPDLYGYAIFVNGGLLAVFQIRAGRAVARRRGMRILAVASVISALGYGLLAIFSQHLVLILLCVMVWTIGEMMDAPVRNAVVSALARPESRVRYLGLVSAALTVGFCVGPWIGAEVLQALGREALWLGTAACALASAGIRIAVTGRVEARLAKALPERGTVGS